MREWKMRTKEVAYLLNPAFCSRILYGAVKKYNEISNRAFPFPLIYLVLPLVLHKNTRRLINSKTAMLVWVKKYPELFIGFAQRASDLVEITNEAVELLLQSGLLQLKNEAGLQVNKTIRAMSKTKFTDDEIKECVNKSEHVGKWFAVVGSTETIYISLGVRP
jgi:hypothetical protein